MLSPWGGWRSVSVAHRVVAGRGDLLVVHAVADQKDAVLPAGLADGVAHKRRLVATALVDVARANHTQYRTTPVSTIPSTAPSTFMTGLRAASKANAC
ncbi:hypothetical protein HMPREF3167_04470 [Trueperella sp. HMSC08B05]|nr:hypothetical protein HMPREF3174_07975 [Trueperella sp. HMSC08H06]OFS74781.1 hypothetical protein HMPREF3167_04470 [Trueperella sp. HMSC08B05]